MNHPSLLDALWRTGALRTLDHALAQSLRRLDPDTPDTVLAAAALVSLAVSAGHAGFDPADPQRLVDAPHAWPPPAPWPTPHQPSPRAPHPAPPPPPHPPTAPPPPHPAPTPPPPHPATAPNRHDTSGGKRASNLHNTRGPPNI